MAVWYSDEERELLDRRRANVDEWMSNKISEEEMRSRSKKIHGEYSDEMILKYYGFDDEDVEGKLWHIDNWYKLLKSNIKQLKLMECKGLVLSPESNEPKEEIMRRITVFSYRLARFSTFMSKHVDIKTYDDMVDYDAKKHAEYLEEEECKNVKIRWKEFLDETIEQENKNG